MDWPAIHSLTNISHSFLNTELPKPPTSLRPCQLAAAKLSTTKLFYFSITSTLLKPNRLPTMNFYPEPAVHILSIFTPANPFCIREMSTRWISSSFGLHPVSIAFMLPSKSVRYLCSHFQSEVLPCHSFMWIRLIFLGGKNRAIFFRG